MGVEKIGSQCRILTGKDPTKDSTFEVLDSDNNDGLKIDYKHGGVCDADPTQDYKLTVNVYCDKNVLVLTDDYTVDDTTDSCARVISFNHKSGCSIDQLSAFWDWIQDNRWIMFAILVVIGTIICFLGRSLFKPVLFMCGCILTVGVVMLIFYSTFLKSNTETWVGWAVLGGSVVAGLLVGFIFVKIAKLGAFVLAGLGGYAVSLLIYNAFLYKMNSVAGFWAFTLGVALVFAILALFFFDHILIHSTALLGSYMVINGIGLVAGRYQNPFTLYQYIDNGEIDEIDPMFYAYLAANFILYLLGIIFQYRQRKNDKVSGNDPYQRLR